MEKLSRTELRDAVLNDESLSEEVKKQLLDLIKTPSFGLVWEEKTEDVIENLREELPVLQEVKERAIISEDPEAPNHVLIEADNLEALIALTYTHAEKFDAIYLDPPYNSGATDWRYNNDYVDKEDAYRHSKWLCMMEHRLRLVRRLLNPLNSVLIVTIDEREYHHLGCLLEQMFPTARIQMVSSVISPQGNPRKNQFNRVDEYLYFVQLGESSPELLPLSDEWRRNAEDKRTLGLLWQTLMRTGNHSERAHSPNCFYPILVSPDGKQFMGVGEPLGREGRREDYVVPEGCVAIWPIHTNGKEGVWNLGGQSLLEIQKKGYVKLGNFTPRGMAIQYLPKGQIEKVESGLLKIDGYNEDGSIISNSEVRRIDPGTQWRISTHDATRFGTQLLRDIFGDKVFAFPKSLYAVEDALNFFIAYKPNALVLDAFAGSGTTMHAIMDLNRSELFRGNRQCFLISNNENHICEEVTYERNKRVIQGYTTPKGEHVPGLTVNSLRYYRVAHTPRKHTHENKMLLSHAMTEMLQIKWNAYTEPERFGSLRVKPKYMRYFQGDEDVLIIYVPEIIPYIVKEIKAMPEGKPLHVYVATDGIYAYSEEFSEVSKRIELAAIPSAYYNAIKSILPAPKEEHGEYVPSADDEYIIEQADKNDYQD